MSTEVRTCDSTDAARAAEPRAAEPRAAEAAEATAANADHGPAVRDEDHEWAKLDRFKRTVDRSLDAIRKATEHGRIGVSFSGGKDSTCTLDLVRRIVPDAPAAFFDSGAEFRCTHEIVAALGVETILPRISIVEMARYAGWFGYRTPIDPGCPFDAKIVCIQECDETFVVKRGLGIVAIGMRIDESAARAVHLRVRGELYRGANRTWYCNPIAKWRTEDVWAYIASRGLRYNRAYDVMSERGIPRDDQRVATLLGDLGYGGGRHAITRMVEPDTWAALEREFPRLGQLS